MMNESETSIGVSPDSVEIPEEFQCEGNLPGGKTQVLDSRYCYRWDISFNRYVICDSVADHAEQEGFVSPEVEAVFSVKS